jgi:protein-S-isoprenylcysteine O-methyltransferase Ste14
VPFTIHQFFPLNESVFVFKPILFQVLLIVSLPGLLAVKELVIKGRGTPFPYDKTQFLVTTGVYAYIRNPIQWSFTFLFVPLSLYYESPWILIGSVVSLIYSLSIANQQEFDDMETRFGEAWVSYKKNVPSWFFIWQPKAIAPAQIYFKKDCSYCQELRAWLEKKQTYNLEFIDAHEYKKHLTQVTYVDKEAREYSSLNALLNAVQHVNLFWASLAWVLMLPGINHLIQAIIDGLGLFDEAESCSIKQP